MIQKQTLWQSYIIVGILLVLCIYAVFYKIPAHRTSMLSVASFEDCVLAGNPVMESYPRQCAHNGVTYIETIPDNQALVMEATIYGTVSIGPSCPVVQEGVPCNTPIEAYTSRQAYLYGRDGTRVISKDYLDESGRYEFTVPAGTYYIEIVPAGIGRGELKQVDVVSGGSYQLDFDIDTGIR